VCCPVLWADSPALSSLCSIPNMKTTSFWLSATVYSIYSQVPSIPGAAVAQAVYCLTTGWTIGVQSPTDAEDFSSKPSLQTGSWAHPASYPMGTGGPFPGGKARPGRDADHSPPSSAEVKYE
jgi:hypothetical protein